MNQEQVNVVGLQRGQSPVERAARVVRPVVPVVELAGDEYLTAIDAGIAGGETHIISLPHKIAVAWVYLTGWVRRDGTVEFRDDVYKHDDSLDRNALAQAVNDGGFVQPAPVASFKRVSIDTR